jgi:peptidoglycan/LPS O-acetylase OafA/YrhL
MFFYAIFALTLSIWYEMRVVLCAIIMLGLVLLGLFIRLPDDVILYFYSQSIMLDFVLGMILGVFRDQLSAAMRRMSVLPWLALSLGLCLLVAFSYLPVAPSAYAPPTNTLLTFGVPAALIVMAAIGFEDAKTHGQPWRLLQGIGNASYSIYLTHFFVIGALSAFASRADLSPTPRTLLALMAIPLTAMVGIAVYRLFESPVMAMLARRNPRTKPVLRT